MPRRTALHLNPPVLLPASPLSRGCALVFLNGNILGVHRRPKYFVRSFREMRRRGKVGEFVSVYLQHDTVQIASDGGRVCRPLIICDRGVPRVTDEHLQVRCVGCWWCCRAVCVCVCACVCGCVCAPHVGGWVSGWWW